MKKIFEKSAPNPNDSIPRLLACFALLELFREHRCPHQPRVSCVGWLAAQRLFAPYICPTKNPPVRPYFKSNFFPLPKFQRASARKHPPPPGTGTEPDAPHAIGAVQAAGTHQFAQVLLNVGPAVRNGREKLKPTRTRHRNHPNQQTTETKPKKVASARMSLMAWGHGTYRTKDRVYRHATDGTEPLFGLCWP